MKIAFLGDSITQGVGPSSYDKVFHQIIERELKIECLNYGISATRIARRKALSNPHFFDMYFGLRFDLIDKDSDFIFVFGGTNDYGHGDAKLGDINDKTDFTFYGAMNNLIEKCVNTFGKNNVCFILPLRRLNGDDKNYLGYSLKDYVDVMKEVLDKNNIDYIDLFYNGFPTPTDAQKDKYTADGLHPNDFGSEFIAKKVIEYLKNKNLK